MNRHYSHKIRAAGRKRSGGKLQRGQVALKAIRRSGKPQPQFLDILQHSQRLAKVTHNGLTLSLLAFKANEPPARTQQGAYPCRHTEAANRIKRRIEADVGKVDLVLLLGSKTRKPLFILPGSKSVSQSPAKSTALTTGSCSQVKQGVIAQSEQGRSEHRVESLVIGTARKQTHHRSNQLNFLGIRERRPPGNQALKARIAQSLRIYTNI